MLVLAGMSCEAEYGTSPRRHVPVRHSVLVPTRLCAVYSLQTFRWKKISASNAQAQLPRACACLLFECRISISTQTHTVRACAFRNSRSVSLALRVQGLQVHVQEVTPARELAESAALDSRGRARHETPQGNEISRYNRRDLRTAERVPSTGSARFRSRTPAPAQIPKPTIATCQNLITVPNAKRNPRTAKGGAVPNAAYDFNLAARLG